MRIAPPWSSENRREPPGATGDLVRDLRGMEVALSGSCTTVKTRGRLTSRLSSAPGLGPRAGGGANRGVRVSRRGRARRARGGGGGRPPTGERWRDRLHRADDGE